MHIKKSLRFQKYPVLCRRSLNKLPESAFGISFILIGKSTMAFFKRPVMLRTQIRFTQVGPRTRISALFRRRT